MNKDDTTGEKERRTSAEVNALKERVIAVKKRLPAGPLATFVSRFPQYNTYKKSSRVNNVLTCRIVDEEITDLLEELATEYELNRKPGDETIS